MKIDELQALIALAQYRSFSKAAVRLNITQPGVTKRLQSLSSFVGQPLYERRSGSIRLTGAGEKLLESAQRVVDSLEDAKSIAKSLSGTLSGDLYLACSHHIGLHYLGPLLHLLRERHPSITLRCEFMDSDQVALAVRRGQSDVGLATLGTELDTKLVQSHIQDNNGQSKNGQSKNIQSDSLEPHTRVSNARRLWADPLKIVCQANHQFAAEQPSLLDLKNEPAILPASSTYTGRLIHQFFSNNAIVIRPYLEGNFVETIKSLIQANLGWGVIPQSMCSSDLVSIQPNDGTPFDLVRSLGIIYPQPTSLSKSEKPDLEDLKPNIRAFDEICSEVSQSFK